MGVAILKAVLSLGLTLLILSIIAFLFVPRDAPGLVPAILSIAANVITVVGCGIVLRKLSAKKHQ